jgi:ribonuclease HI
MLLKIPSHGFYKINCDANLSHEGIWGLGAVVRSDGFVLAVATWWLKEFDDPAAAEAMAMAKAMEFAFQCCFTKVVVESDCNALLRALEKKEKHLTYFGSFVTTITNRSRLFSSGSFKHVNRKGNIVAHLLAQYAVDSGDSIWIGDLLFA